MNKEQILEKHLATVIGDRPGSYKEVSEMKGLPEWNAVLKAMEEYKQQVSGAETSQEKALHKHIVTNWAYFPEHKPNYGDEILLQYPPEQCRTMPKITTIYDRDTELIDGCKFIVVTPCL